MRTLRDLDECPRPVEGTAVTIGAYDGVHLGHRAVIANVQRLAAERGLSTAVVTFDRHPASVVRPESAPRLLTDLDQKLELLEDTGVDYTLVVHFDEARSKESAEDFVREVLVGCLNAKLVVVGADFHFGHRRLGNVPLLQDMGRELGFDVIGLPLVGQDGTPARDEQQVSSTAIRRALVAGDVTLATALLGREYELRGVVEHGDERGRTWGFPTANVAVPDDILLPSDGIYAGWYVRPSGERVPAAISLGRRPTVYDAQPYRLLEVHLLDWDGDLYGETARVQFVAHLHNEEKFDSVDDLLVQIQRDCDQARRLLLP
jgi:riboflavin kinase / FMN adenylyltransferase